MAINLSDVSPTYDIRCVRHGFILLTLAFVSGLAIPLYSSPKTGLAAHVIGITAGLFLITVGFVMPTLNLTSWQKSLTYWTFLVSLYLGFLTQVAGAIFGLTRMFVVTASGNPPGPIEMETIVEIMVKIITPLTIIPCLFVLYGLRRPR